MKAEEFDLEANIISCDISYRGGSIRWDVSSMFDTGDEPAIMGTSQNYLGGGIAGAIENGYMFNPKALPADQFEQLQILKERMKRYHYDLNNGGGDEYMQEEVNSYEFNQNLPASYPGL